MYFASLQILVTTILPSVSDIFSDSGSDSDSDSKEDKTKLYINFQIIVKIIVLMMRIIIFKIWGGTVDQNRQISYFYWKLTSKTNSF